MRPWLLLPLLLSLVAGGVACKKKTQTDLQANQTAPVLLQQGKELIRRGKFEDARKSLRLIEDYLPSSPEFPEAKLLIADSFFFAGIASYPEARVEYQSFLNYFPRHEMRDYALFHVGLCHYASIESADRDQEETRKAIHAFENLLKENPGTPYALVARAKIDQCWRRIAEHELSVGIFYVNYGYYPGAENRLKALLETYPDFVDRERAYFYLAESLRLKYGTKEEVAKLKEEAKGYYKKLVESYPETEWGRRAQDRLHEMGVGGFKEELDS